MILAMRDLLIEKGVVTSEQVRQGFERLDSWVPARGADVVARAWLDPEFKTRLLTDGNAAVAEQADIFLLPTPTYPLEPRQ